MTEDDYPALYKDAGAASLRAQTNFYRALICSLALLVVSAGLTLVNYPAAGFTVLQAIVLLGSLALTVYLAQKRPQRIWYGTRALAESIKTITWRFAMRAEPYDKNDTIARDKFVSNIKNILRDNELSAHVVAYTEGDQITRAMSDSRLLDLSERKTKYDSERIREQLEWYRKKARYNDKRSRQWFYCLVILHAVALGSVFGKFMWPNFAYWPTSVFLAAASGTVAWLQTKRFQELAATYSLTAHEIGLLRAKLADVNTDNELSAFVGDAENAFSREHTQWRARRDMN